MPGLINMTIGELRELLLELIEYAEIVLDMAQGNAFSASSIRNVRRCIGKAQRAEAELQVLDCAAFLTAILAKVGADAPV